MVFALVGDSTMTSEPLPLALGASTASSSRGSTTASTAGTALTLSLVLAVFGVAAGLAVFAAFFFFTTGFLAATDQPFIIGRPGRPGRHVHQPAPVRASDMMSCATCAAVFLSVSTFASAWRYAASRSFRSAFIRSTGSSPINNGRVPRSEERRVGKECRTRWAAEDGQGNGL